jgi:hypothetical protein
MSESEPETVPSAPAETADAGTRGQTSRVRRVLDWYTCRPERESARRSLSVSARDLTLLARARAALASGNLLREPSDPARKPLAGAHAAALYADALTWALLPATPGVEPSNGDAPWTGGPAVAQALGLPEERAAEVSRLLQIPRLGMALADRSEREQADAAALLKRAALVAIDVRERPVRVVDGIILIAVARIVLTVLVFAVVLGTAFVLRPQKPNLAAGKPWKASSSLFDCHPDQGECGGARTRILFHTRDEQDPWFEYDLGIRTTFSSLRIDNRQDGEGERAVPLVVEVGDDDAHFRQVARRDDEFSSWSPSFPPVTARYVRLRVPRHSMLHLEEVDVYR